MATSSLPESATRRIVQQALELGFDAVGVVSAAPPETLAAYDGWISQGFHGEMAYLERHRDLRADPTLLVPGALSTVVVALCYGPLEGSDANPGLARYAQGADYHRLMRKRLRTLGKLIDKDLGPGACVPRPTVDSAPVLERDLARRAGIGWFSKSANLLSQTLGSAFLLGELWVGHDLVPAGEPPPERCGRCTACLSACPTGAIVAPGVVDSRRCLSYLTIELRGEIPRELRGPMGDHLFGCDVCQTVCPWNRKAKPGKEPALFPRPGIAELGAVDFLLLGEGELRARLAGTALLRPGREGLARNAAVVLGNSRDDEVIPSLVQALSDDPSPLVRRHTAWALGQIGGPRARAALAAVRGQEADERVVREISAALEGAEPEPSPFSCSS